jgi:hypothetical protein
MDDYIVQPGDTLPGVAERCLGSSSRWDEISRLNNLVGPVNLFIGQRLVLPPDAYTCTKSTTQLNYSAMPPNASFASEGDQRPASLVMARGFMFIIVEQLPEIGVEAGKIIRKVAVVPKDFALNPANLMGKLSPAEHALNLNPSASQFLSASDRAFGSPSIVGKPLLLDIAKIEAAGGRVISVTELVADLQRYVAQNPAAKTQVERLIWAVKDIEGEVLVAGGTPKGSGATISSLHETYVKSAEELWQAFRKGNMTKAELERG